jgi:hypothetical protein
VLLDLRMPGATTTILIEYLREPARRQPKIATAPSTAR